MTDDHNDQVKRLPPITLEIGAREADDFALALVAGHLVQIEFIIVALERTPGGGKAKLTLQATNAPRFWNGR